MDHLVIKRSARARRLALRLDPKERVINLVVPKGMSMRKAEEFAHANQLWIEERIAELPPAVPFEDGRIIPILGRDRYIDIYYDPDLKRTDVHLQAGFLTVKTNKEDPSARIERYLRGIAKDVLTELSYQKAAQIRKRITSVSVRDTKSRWGSCAQGGSLSYSWRLIFAPTVAMDYVVAHEVAHLTHLNHSQKFWNLCRDLSDDYVEGEYWMRNHGHELMRYGVCD